jgi:hypothetical protein
MEVPVWTVTGGTARLCRAVVAMLTVKEWGIERVLEEPYQAARQSAATLTPFLRRFALATMSAFVIALLAGNLLTVGLLARAREESVKGKMRTSAHRNGGAQKRPAPRSIPRPAADRGRQALARAAARTTRWRCL